MSISQLYTCLREIEDTLFTGRNIIDLISNNELRLQSIEQKINKVKKLHKRMIAIRTVFLFLSFLTFSVSFIRLLVIYLEIQNAK